MPSANNKRIAKNTLLLYFRMIITMLVSLYTSRVVLNTLGVEDFGIYNVVGGVVAMFGFLNSSMASATQRFLSFELGRQDYAQLKKVFSMSLNIHFLIAIVIFILAETVGLWFLNTRMVIPAERMEAAQWVYQFSVLAFMVTILSVPYNASIIAYEKMNVFAYISILEVSLKLLIVFMLQWFDYDKLKLFAVLTFSVSLIIRIIYGGYCKRKLPTCTYAFVKDKALFRTLFSYTGWNLWGNLAAVTMGQGINILLNLFFGPVVNAARGIAYQVSSAVTQFVTNFQMAVNPQIIKSYASGDRKYMHQLIFTASKYSFFLLFTLALPLLLETEYVLKLWLKIVPDYAVLFTRLVLCIVLVDCISGPLMTAAQASGDIKVYQSVLGGMLLFILPISYMFLKLGYPPETAMYVNLIISFLVLIVRLFILDWLIKFPIKEFSQKVLIRILIVVVMSFIGSLLYKTSSISLHPLLNIALSATFVIFISYGLGISRSERNNINNKISLIVYRSDMLKNEKIFKN